MKFNFLVGAAIVACFAGCGKTSKDSDSSPAPRNPTQDPSNNDGEKDEPNRDGEKSRALMFKAVGGEHSYVLPLVAVYKYDNGPHGYLFQRTCWSEKDAAINFLGVNSPNQEIPGYLDVGIVGGSSASCQMDGEVLLKDETLTVKGEWNRQADKFDIVFKKVDASEFFADLKNLTTGKGKDYRYLPADERRNYEEACKLFAGKDCSELL